LIRGQGASLPMHTIDSLGISLLYWPGPAAIQNRKLDLYIYFDMDFVKVLRLRRLINAASVHELL
jgi:hypothetical protein